MSSERSDTLLLSLGAFVQEPNRLVAEPLIDDMVREHEQVGRIASRARSNGVPYGQLSDLNIHLGIANLDVVNLLAHHQQRGVR